jgi:hypothetical protein
MHWRPLLIAILATSLLFALNPFAEGAVPDIRYQMLVSAQIDGYSTDDDVIAISRYLIAVGDRETTCQIQLRIGS